MVYTVHMTNKLYVFRNGIRVRALEDKQCPVCHEWFSPEVSKRKYCSRRCYYQMKRIRGDRVIWTDEMREKMSQARIGEKNPMYGRPAWDRGKKRPEMTGEKHFGWKGGFWINEYGYKVIQNERQTAQKKVLEHKDILERKIGRKIMPNEVTHHINGDKLDNRPDNLEVMTRAEHMDCHRSEISRGIRR